MLDTGDPQRLTHPVVDDLLIKPEVCRAECHILGDRGGDDLVVGILEDDTDKLAHLTDILFGDGFSPDEDRTRGRPEDTIEVLEKGALPGTI